MARRSRIGPSAHSIFLPCRSNALSSIDNAALLPNEIPSWSNLLLARVSLNSPTPFWSRKLYPSLPSKIGAWGSDCWRELARRPRLRRRRMICFGLHVAVRVFGEGGMGPSILSAKSSPSASDDAHQHQVPDQASRGSIDGQPFRYRNHPAPPLRYIVFLYPPFRVSFRESAAAPVS